ncbi:MAG: aminotransferase [Myxococcota bacterium]|nr:aminotransferase [Myxococcota bacterium]
MSESEELMLPDHLWRPLTQHSLLQGKPRLCMVEAKGCYFTDENGKTYLDTLAGLWCVNVGYGRQELADAAHAQMSKLPYISPIFTAEPTSEFANKLKSMLKMDGHVYFSSSGSEANETAFKIARQHHLQSGAGGERRFKIISRYRAYHGNTMGAMAATGQAERKIGYEPGPAGFVHVMPPYPYRAHPKLSLEDHGEECARVLEETIIYEGAETVAAVIMEPLISGGGVLVPPDNYLPRVREICDRYGVLLIFDEVVSGFGRTGEMFAHLHWKTLPDIITFAKGLASGYMPVAATFAREEVFQSFLGEAGDTSHFRQVNTFGGHPVAAAVAMRNIQIVEEEDLPANAAAVGEYLRGELASAVGEHPNVGEIRGKGLLTGVELVVDRESKVPLAESDVTKLLAHAMERGVLLGRNTNTIPGRCNVLLISPPLILTREDADRIVEAVHAALADLSDRGPAAA